MPKARAYQQSREAEARRRKDREEGEIGEEMVGKREREFEVRHRTIFI